VWWLDSCGRELGGFSTARSRRIRPLALAILLLAAPRLAGGTGIRLVSHLADSETSAPPDRTYWESMSTDGDSIVFRSVDTGFVKGVVDANLNHDLFEWQGSTGEVLLISHSGESLLQTANGPSFTAFASSDGRYVAFASLATDLVSGVADSNQSSDAFLWDRTTGVVTLASSSAALADTTANGGTSPAGISADGRYVLLVSVATDLLPGGQDLNGEPDLFLWDSQTGSQVLITHTFASPTTAANHGAGIPAVLSADGTTVAYLSSATDLVAGMIPGPCAGNAFAWNRASGTNFLVSHAAGTDLEAANGCAAPVAISNDGSELCFSSGATNLVSGQLDTNGTLDAFLWHRDSGQVVLVSHVSDSPSTAGNGPSEPQAISGDGRFVVLDSLATNLVAGVTDGNAASDAFIYDSQSAALSLVSHALVDAETTSAGASDPVAVGADGAVLLESYAADVTGDQDLNGTGDIYFWKPSEDPAFLISRASGSPGASDRYTEAEALSSDGRRLGMVSFSTNLVPGASPSTPQVYQGVLPLFADGFQTGDESHWSLTVP
jgi:hypothetical protein